ncbi:MULTISPECIES: LysR family transcriptional regulator [unclassified Streptomyces]|uniref:LysR family transcriptional regulator n=1 Tax=unclassified Streptomyces TaxID=2593676 RepID=UPI003369CD20
MDLTGIPLRYFLEVARTGSISQASERLRVAASAISRQIAKLEHDIGVPLFERRPRGMVLSDAGEMLAAYARRSQLESEQILADLRGLDALGHSTIKLASSEGFARDFLPEAVVAFRASFPGVRFRLRVTSPAEATREVREGTADLAVTYSVAPEEGVRVEYSRRQPIHALVPAGHPLAEREEVSLADLLPYPLALMEPGTTIRQLFDICVSLEGLAFEPAFVSNYSGALQGFVQNHGGVTLAGYLTFRRLLHTEGLAFVPISNPELSRRSVQIQSMARRVLPPAVAAFRDHLIEHIEAP